MKMFRTIIFIAIATIQLSSTSAVITPDPECGTTKGCYPSTCPQGGCTGFHLSWEDAGEYVRFKMVSSVSDVGLEWAAVGFSLDDKMKNTSVVMCRLDTMSAEIGHTDAVGYSYTSLKIVSSLTNITVSRTGTYLTCLFARIKIPTEFTSQIFALDLPSLYILNAKGPLTAGRPGGHTFRQASTSPLSLMDIGQPTSASLTTEPPTSAPSPTTTGPIPTTISMAIRTTVSYMLVTCVSIIVTFMFMQ